MGLDIYLYRYDADIEEINRKEAEYERLSEQQWETLAPGLKYEDIPEAKKEEIRAANEALKAQMGLGEWGEDPRKVKIEEDSKLYPEHYFKVGYCRSSYNGGGFNRVVGNLGLMDLYKIFAQDGEGELNPDWPAVRRNALATRDGINSRIAEGNNLRAMMVNASMFAERPSVTNEAQAIELVMRALAKDKQQEGEGFRSYGSSEGEFMLDGMEILAAIPGQACLGPDGVYLVYRDKSLDWYAQACEIIAEMCDYVTSHPGTYRLHWSG